MPVFNISATVTASCWTEVEADTEAEALGIARRRSMPDVLIDCGYPVDEYWHIDADGEPTGIKVSE